MASTATVLLGNEYVIEQKIVAIRKTYRINDRDGKRLAYVKKKIISWGPQLWFETPDGTRFGEIRGKVLTVRSTFEIYDTQGLVAVVKKKILKLVGSEWWLEDSSGKEIARIKGNITKHNFTVHSPSGLEIAHVHKKWVSVRDSYAIEILTQDLTPYIVIAYVIAMDNINRKFWKILTLGLGGIAVGDIIDIFSHNCAKINFVALM
jgi:uncharacterized protein YxjI